MKTDNESRVPDGYVSLSACGHAQALATLPECSICRTNVIPDDRPWTRLPRQNFHGKEGVDVGVPAGVSRAHPYTKRAFRARTSRRIGRTPESLFAGVPPLVTRARDRLARGGQCSDGSGMLIPASHAEARPSCASAMMARLPQDRERAGCGAPRCSPRRPPVRAVTATVVAGRELRARFDAAKPSGLS